MMGVDVWLGVFLLDSIVTENAASSKRIVGIHLYTILNQRSNCAAF